MKDGVKAATPEWRVTEFGTRTDMGDGWVLIVSRQHRGSGYFWSCEGKNPLEDKVGSARTLEQAQTAAVEAWAAK